jgi:hypothetical protein
MSEGMKEGLNCCVITAEDFVVAAGESYMWECKDKVKF